MVSFALKKYFPFILLFSVFFFCGIFLAHAAPTDSDSVIVKQEVSTCVVNGVCDAAENASSCPMDCHIACSDHTDNDGDGLIDYPADPGCTSATDTDEYNAPVVPPVVNSGSSQEPENGSYVPGVIQFSNLRINAGTLQATISWTTNSETSAKVFWGRTRDYGDGSLSSLDYEQNHEAELANLSPGTVYYFEITARTYSGALLTEQGSFVTANPGGKQETPNVSDLQISGDASGLVVAWRNPADQNFASVKVVKKLSGFPQDPSDGDLLYEGTGEFVFDQNVRAGSRYYYGVFAKSKSGDFASGVVGSFLIGSSGGEKGNEGGGNGDLEGTLPGTHINQPGTSTSSGGNTTPYALSLSDFIFTQGNNTIPISGGGILKLDPGIPFAILLPSQAVRNGISSVLFERTNDDTNAKTNYLLYKDQNEDVYRALLPAYFTKGKYPFRIFVVQADGNYYTLSGTIQIVASSSESMNSGGKTEIIGFLTKNPQKTIIFSIFLLLLLILLLLLRHYQKLKLP
ncbi:MAG TPA: fibronectin type III domain-containing protein [Candidatus Paceibacterota bacterium]|nr:fibronectin type III domain-containing protein [Candidatus Paceibacterota bacterium]